MDIHICIQDNTPFSPFGPLGPGTASVLHSVGLLTLSVLISMATLSGRLGMILEVWQVFIVFKNLSVKSIFLG